MSNNETTTAPKRAVHLEGADMALKITRLLENLITCLTQETLAIQSHNRGVAEKMNQEKTHMMHSYKNLHTELSQKPDIFKNLDPDIKSHLQKLTAEFEIALKDNITAIIAGRGAATRLIERILNRVREATSTNTKSYNNAGKMVEQKSSRTIMPTKLNETY